MSPKEAKITLSQALISSAVSFLPVLAALVTFVYESRVAGISFWLLILVSVGCYVYSVLCGGWGIGKTAKNEDHGYFNRQAYALLFGFVALAAAFLATSEKPDQNDMRILALQESVMKLEARVDELGKGAGSKGDTAGIANISYEFLYASSSITPLDGSGLDKIVAAIERRPPKRVIIKAHADTAGDDAFNYQLSLRRAAALRTEIAGRVAASLEYLTLAAGERELSELTPDARDSPANRHATVTLEY